MRRCMMFTALVLASLGIGVIGCTDGPLSPEPPPAEDALGPALDAVASKKGPKSGGDLPGDEASSGEALFGPETFVRGPGKPVVEQRTVSLEGYGAPYTLRIRNGDEQGRKRVSSGEVHAGGERVLGPSDFSPRIAGYEIPVEASGSFELAVELRGGPGSELTAWVEGTPLPASVAVTPEAVLIESLGETASFAAEVFGPQGEPLDDPVTWSSSDEAVATVDGDGVVTAVANGEATITAASGAASGEAHVEVQVEEDEGEGDGEEPASWFAGVELSTTTITIDGGLVSYTVTLDNVSAETLSNVNVQAWAEQPDVSKPAAGHSVFCGAGVGVLPADGCTDDMTLNVGNSSPHGTGTLEPGPATIKLELKQGFSNILDTFTVDVTLVAEEPGSEEPDAETSTLELSATDLTANGETTATATVTLYDAAGVRVTEGGHDVAFEITPINENTAGATITGVTDNGDGTYTATFIAPVNNGAGTLTATLPEPINADLGMFAAGGTGGGTGGGTVVGSAELTYSGGNTLPTASAGTLLFPEDVGGAFTLSGTDADGDELTWRLVEIYRRNGYGDTEYTTAAGDTISPPFVWPNLHDTVDIALDDPGLRVIPHTDGSATNFTALTYHVSDGKGASANVTLQVDVHSVNDAPRVTATDLLEIWEDESVSFLFQGHDIELDQYRTLITTPPLERGYLVHHHFTGDITISGPATLQSISDQANEWPSSFTPTPNDYDAVFYNAFGFVFEEINSGLRSEEHTVLVRVLPVNDAPETTLAGFGTARAHHLAATVIDGGTYSLPAVEIDDVDFQGFANVPTYSVSVETNGGAIALDKVNYEDAWVVFTETPTSITWQMEPDVSASGFVSGLTLDALLSSLTYTPSGTGADTLTITVGDQGFFGVCEATKSGTCDETTTTIINLDIQPGTPPADVTVLPLTQAGGE